MMKYATLVILGLFLVGFVYKPQQVNQSWKFDAPEVLSQLDPLSGIWEVVTPAKLNLPLLTQSVKYADYPKVLLKNNQYYDFDLITRLYISSDNQDTQAGGLVLRYRNLYSFYMLLMNTKDKRITLTKATLAGFKIVKRVNYEFAPDRWYELKANCYLDQIKVSVDGQLILEAEDKSSTGGKVGLVTAGTSQVYFEGIRVNTEKIEVVKQ
jgi:hypothetical protein